MNPAAAPTIKRAPKEYLEIYSLYRERVSQEDNLVNHRMGWMLWSNGIFFGFFAALLAAVSSNNQNATWTSRFEFASTAVGIFGIICTSGSILSIHAALDEIEHLHSMYVTKYPEIQAAEREHLMPGLVGHKNYHGLGKVVPRLMPFAILALWFALLAFEYLRLR